LQFYGAEIDFISAMIAKLDATPQPQTLDAEIAALEDTLREIAASR
jgi:hypothetical protein